MLHVRIQRKKKKKGIYMDNSRDNNVSLARETKETATHLEGVSRCHAMDIEG